MKTKQLATLLLTLILAIGCLSVGVTAATVTVVEGTKGSITIENALEHDTLAAYKVIDITYNAGSNTLTHAWNSAFAEYFAGTTQFNTHAYTVEQFDLLADDSPELKSLLAGLPNYISTKNIAPVVDPQTIAEGSTTATFANLAMGEYFIRPTNTTSVYQLMLQKLEPTVVDGVYKLSDVEVEVKKAEVNITKAADKTSVTKNEKVNYTITVDIPTYSDESTDKSFYVSDLLPDGLTIDTTSISVKINEADITNQAGTRYTLDTTATNAYTFKLSVSTGQYADANYWSANGGKQLVITYTATLNDDDTTAVNVKETNTATFDYSNYPYVADSHVQKTATVDVTTFAIKIDKFVKDNETSKLAGAKFDLYRTATQAEIDAVPAVTVTIPHTEVQGVKLEGDLVTDENGVATFAKYEANGDRYDYYLVETQAPSGYNLLKTAVKVNFTDANVDSDGVYTVKVPNSSGIQLPITGGTGTILFTVIGIALMAGAVVLLVISHKKSKATEGK